MFLSSREKASKSLRRLTKAKISTPVSQVPITALELPKKIIKALYDYQAKAPHELSFKMGDFFHVTGRENDLDWFEACNPATNLKGIVPVNFFQVIDKTERSLAVNRPTSSSSSSNTLTSAELDSGFSDMSINHGYNSKKKQHNQVYGIVMYDFKAERPDELDAQAGEAIVVIAQSNHEWFVAKPIGRLGGPGLIPVSFVQVRDASTGQIIDSDHESIAVPGVEDWKKMTLNYEASSIPLGVFDKKALASSQPTTPTTPTFHPANMTAAATAAMASTSTKTRLSDTSTTSTNSSVSHHQQKSTDLVTFASVDSFILEGDQYWFVIYARVNQGSHRILYRLYEDFYDFQINLLQTYPVEAGKADRERILPYMPGPLTFVDEEITAERQVDLDQYCKDLLNLPHYLSECDLVQKQLFGIHEGDIELDYDPRGSQVAAAAEEESNKSYLMRQPSTTTTIHPTATNTTAPNTPTPTYSRSTSSLLQALPQPPPDLPLHQAVQQQQQQQQQIKIKIVYKQDMFAMKVPADCSLDYLSQKVFERIGEKVKMQYKNEASGINEPLEGELDMEEAFVQAIQRGKLTVTAVAILEE